MVCLIPIVLPQHESHQGCLPSTRSEIFEGKGLQFMAIVPECRSSTVIRDVQRHKDHDSNGRVTDLQDRRERYT